MADARDRDHDWECLGLARLDVRGGLAAVHRCRRCRGLRLEGCPAFPGCVDPGGMADAELVAAQWRAFFPRSGQGPPGRGAGSEKG